MSTNTTRFNISAQERKTALRVRVLGAAAGGGFPQWNCGCRNCCSVRDGKQGFTPRTQSSIAVTGDNGDWALLNASPDLRAQILQSPAFFPNSNEHRHSPIKRVVVTNGDIDHIAGLLTLREVQPFDLIATAEIHSVIAQNAIFNALNAAVVNRIPVQLDKPFELMGGITATLFPVPGKVPLFMEDDNVQTDLVGEQTVGVELEAYGKTAFYIPGCATLTDDLRARLSGAQLVFFDGTLWDDDEMIQQKVGHKTGTRMGHISMNGPQGSIAAFANLDIGRKVFIHINNTNPVLDDNSRQRKAAEAAGWEIAFDGMEITP